jgi:hypothetical protein
MQKLLLSLHINRPNIDLSTSTGFRVFDDKSLRLCDRSIREGCFGRHTTTAYVAFGPVYYDMVLERVAGYRSPDGSNDTITERFNFLTYVRGIGTPFWKVGFDYDWSENQYVPWPQGRVTYGFLQQWSRFCEALGCNDLYMSKDVIYRDGAVMFERALLYKLLKRRSVRRSSV